MRAELWFYIESRFLQKAPGMQWCGRGDVLRTGVSLSSLASWGATRLHSSSPLTVG